MPSNRRRPNWRLRLERRAINHLRRRWNSDSTLVVVEDRKYQLGQGEPRLEVVFHNAAILPRLMRSPSLEFGDAYVRGDIELRGSLSKLMQAIYLMKPEEISSFYRRSLLRLCAAPRKIVRNESIDNARHHYNIGTDFYRLWLDPSMTYSCAYYPSGAEALADAQRLKLELLCRKARLQPGQHLLDIGCGWGSLLIHAARYHGVYTTGVTAAEDQAHYVESIAHEDQLAGQIRVLSSDWRDLDGKFDRIISVGMFEHVGIKQYQEFFQQWRRLLADGGLSILHTIGRMKPAASDPWITKHIFPGGYLPTLAEIAQCAAEADLCVVDVENLKRHYARTLAHWLQNFEERIDVIAARHGKPFARMWSLYLHGAEAAFRWGDLQLWQIVLAKDRDHPWPLNRETNPGIAD
jgi:cyclopropane-fatty-acyl-phospholipid synthase